jgi:hypothetical protein
LSPYRTLPIFGVCGGLWMIPNYLVKIIIPPVTAYTELKEIPPLFFLTFKHSMVGFSSVLMEKFETCARV